MARSVDRSAARLVRMVDSLAEGYQDLDRRLRRFERVLSPFADGGDGFFLVQIAESQWILTACMSSAHDADTGKR